MKYIIIKFSNGDKFRLDPNIIAKMRTEYYSTVDGFEKGSKEWDEEYKQSMRPDELIDWLENNTNWSDIESDVEKIDIEEEYSYEDNFFKAKIEVK